MLDKDRLRSFMRTFFGYGSWSAPLWFVGMEEGGGGSLDEIERRLGAWTGEELEDLRRFHHALGGLQWFAEHPPIQKTWSKLVAVALSAQGQPNDRESIRRHQRDELGRRDGGTALIELFPLPSRSIGDWIYAASGLPELSSREAYTRSLAESRVQAIQERIDLHKPAAVVFYGAGYRQHWESIAASSFRSDRESGVESTRRGPSLMLLAPHPVAHGVSNADFCRIGEFIRSAVSS